MKKVKIGCFVYDVQEVKSVNKYEPRKGEIDYFERVIKIDEDMCEQDKKETLIHEIIHGIDEFMGIGLGEEQVKKLGHGLAMMLLDNPDIIKI
ncbi:hypothetical protein [Tepidibacillus marianensis]|uniref:hypothetical protein n=1 Tax=Tepidibacillus marianensis TaxID=3131995 RepID=UPI0030D4F869